MKIWEIKEKLVSKNIIKSIKCDFCQKTNNESILGNDNGVFEGFIDFSIEGGFGSKFDMERYDIDICDECFENKILKLYDIKSIKNEG
jgi:N-acetylglucosamine-6-phosphate deacetylase